MLPKFIYENLPYGYFIISALLLKLEFNWMTSVSAGLFYAAGCAVLVARSANRRIDHFSPMKQRIPELIYEYLPYTYFAIAIFMLMTTGKVAIQLIAFTLIVISLRNLICRHNNRRKTGALFK